MKREINWQDILGKAVTEPGMVSRAYSTFHHYSLGNKMLALLECAERNLTPGPINTYPGWQRLGRQVRRGERAITLCMPVTGKIKEKAKDADGNEVEKESNYTRFVFRPNWFVMSQTDGAEIPAESIPEWNRESALRALSIEAEEFSDFNGNSQGYALPGRKIAVSPIAENPLKTMFHELGHVLLGHCEEGMMTDGEQTPKTLREVEAESVALLCCESLGLPGAEFSRGYIQSWAPGLRKIPEKSCQKVFKAADAILRAGREKSSLMVV